MAEKRIKILSEAEIDELYSAPTFHVMASLAQMERELMIERTNAGLAAARKRGRVGGRKRSMTDSKVESAKRLLADGIPPKEVADNALHFQNNTRILKKIGN